MIFISLSLVQLHGKEIESLGIVFSLRAEEGENVTREKKGKKEEGRKNEIIVLWGRGNIVRGKPRPIIFTSFRRVN